MNFLPCPHVRIQTAQVAQGSRFFKSEPLIYYLFVFIDFITKLTLNSGPSETKLDLQGIQFTGGHGPKIFN